MQQQITPQMKYESMEKTAQYAPAAMEQPQLQEDDEKTAKIPPISAHIPMDMTPVVLRIQLPWKQPQHTPIHIRHMTQQAQTELMAEVIRAAFISPDLQYGALSEPPSLSSVRKTHSWGDLNQYKPMPTKAPPSFTPSTDTKLHAAMAITDRTHPIVINSVASANKPYDFFALQSRDEG